MVRNPLTIDQVEELAASRIEALSGDDYRQSKKFPARWKEATKALVVDGEAQPRAHLAFNVFAESGRNTGRQRDRHDDTIRTRSDVVVQFMFHLRPGNPIRDQRIATRAARDIVGALLALPQVDVAFDVVNSWRPAVVAGGEWLLVQLDFSADFDLSAMPQTSRT